MAEDQGASTSINRYRKRPPEVEAIQFLGTAESCTEVGDFLGGPHSKIVNWLPDRLRGGSVMVGLHGEPMVAHERWVGFRPGCWIVKAGESFAVLLDEDFQRVYVLAGTTTK